MPDSIAPFRADMVGSLLRTLPLKHAREQHARGDISDADRQRLLEIAGKCPIHKVLEGQISIASSLVAKA